MDITYICLQPLPFLPTSTILALISKSVYENIHIPGTMNNNDEPKIVETTHLPPIVHADGDSDKPRVDHAASSGITSYTLTYSSNYDGNNISAGQNWIGLPANHGAASVAAQESYYPPYFVLAYIMKT